MTHQATPQFPTSPFLAFWHTVNAILRSHGQPEILFAEAYGCWEDYQEKRNA